MFNKKISVYVLMGRGELAFFMGFDTLNDDYAKYTQDDFSFLGSY